MNRKRGIISIFVLLLLLVSAYMLKLNKIGFLGDDWLSLFVIKQKGSSNLVYNYSFDRPLRGFHDKYLTLILGTKILKYQILALFYHFLDSLIFMLILTMVWPKQYKNNLMAASLAIVFPGFLKQLQVFDYSAHFFSHFMLMLSILVTLLPIRQNKKWLYWVVIPISVGLSLASIGVIEWYIGMEILKIFFIYMAFRTRHSKGFLKKTFLYAIPILLSTVGFTYWRLFLFESKRVTVNADKIMSEFSASGYGQIAKSIFENIYRQVISVWYQPFTKYIKHVKPAFIILFSVVALVVGYLILYGSKIHRGSEQSERSDYSILMIVGGLISVISALAPIIFGGRHIDYGNSLNRFSYPGMIGSIMIVVGILSLLKNRIRFVIFVVFLTSSLLVQYGNSIWFEKNFQATRDTWWQMSWRAPKINPGTVLSGRIEYGELIESFTLWGPANLIYYPGNPDVIISAEVLDEETVDWIKDLLFYENEKRGNVIINDFSNMLLISNQFDSCLHVIDGKNPEVSEFDHPLIRGVAVYSNFAGIDATSSNVPVVDPELFGSEPERNWCYFYQKAQLARQQRNWDEVSSLGNQVLEKDFFANDVIEWLVFVQAFKYTDNINYDFVKDIILNNRYLSSEACDVFKSYSTEMENTGIENRHTNLIFDFCN